MANYDGSNENGSVEQNEEDILVASDGGEILTDGGVSEQITTHERGHELEFTAAIETFATPEEVSVEIGVAGKDIVKVAFHSERIRGAFFLQPEQIEELVAGLEDANEELENSDADA